VFAVEGGGAVPLALFSGLSQPKVHGRMFLQRPQCDPQRLFYIDGLFRPSSFRVTMHGQHGSGNEVLGRR
jgi:hypothetical protein